jgi:phospholipase/carboxylesterase
VVWLHGLGADGRDFLPVIPALQLPDDTAVRFIFPHAPMRPITVGGGYRTRAWFDILSTTRLDIVDEAGIRDSQRIADGLLTQQIAAGIAPERIVVAGFSQGGVIALHCALRFPRRLGGVLALSTFLPLANPLGAERSAANADTPILMCHGVYDATLPLVLGTMARDFLRGIGCQVDWHEYPMQHEVCAEEIERIGLWLLQRLG